MLYYPNANMKLRSIGSLTLFEDECYLRYIHPRVYTDLRSSGPIINALRGGHTSMDVYFVPELSRDDYSLIWPYYIRFQIFEVFVLLVLENVRRFMGIVYLGVINGRHDLWISTQMSYSSCFMRLENSPRYVSFARKFD